jgi:hypothetical protein
MDDLCQRYIMPLNSLIFAYHRKKRWKEKQSQASFIFLPIIGVYPRTFQTYIDLTDDDSAGPEVCKLLDPSSFPTLVSMFWHIVLQSLFIHYGRVKVQI